MYFSIPSTNLSNTIRYYRWGWAEASLSRTVLYGEEPASILLCVCVRGGGGGGEVERGLFKMLSLAKGLRVVGI